MMNYSGVVALEVASQLVTGIGDVLTANGRPVTRAFVTMGEVAWDDCACGQLSVAISRIVSTSAFPNETARLGTHCGDMVMLELSIALVRCVPGPDINGTAPTPAALTASAAEALLDAHDVRETATSLLCDLDKSATINDYFIGEQIPLGPSGYCGGTQLVVRVAFTHCMAC